MEKIVGEGEKFERIRRVTGYLAGDVSDLIMVKEQRKEIV